MSSATVRVRQTTTTTTTTASVVVINSGYLKSHLGILKLVIAILSMIIFILVVIPSQLYYANYSRYLFLLLVSFSHMHVVGLMLITCLLSLSTAGLLPKLTFDFVFHFVAFVLYLVAGLWAIVDAMDRQATGIKVASVFALIVAIAHLVHGVFSYRICRTN